jgi:hypothetical protein
MSSYIDKCAKLNILFLAIFLPTFYMPQNDDNRYSSVGTKGSSSFSSRRDIRFGESEKTLFS